MRKILIAVMAMVTMFWFTSPSHANLYDRGNGLIYDDVLKITWLQDANYAKGPMTWSQATTWAANLVYRGYDDWRLPTTKDGFYVFGYDGNTTGGFNITTSEMGYMYYTNLGNKGYYATDGTNPQSGYGFKNTSFKSGGPNGPTVSFQNLQANVYWSDTAYSLGYESAWLFDFLSGNQDYISKSNYNLFYAWAVRPGDVTPVPAPATMLLLGSGLAGLGLFRRVRRRHG